MSDTTYEAPQEPPLVARLRHGAIAVIAVMWSLWQLKVAATVPLAPIPMRTIHLSFAFTLAFLVFPTRRLAPWWIRLALDLTLAALSVAVFLHIKWNFTLPDFRRLVSPEPIDLLFGWLMIALVTIAALRAASVSLALTGVAFVVYAFLGQHLPGAVRHAGFDADRVLSFLYLRVEGVLGVTVGASATLIFPVVLFGGLLMALGGGEFFAQAASAMLGRLSGGTAKISVVASALFGTVAGTGAANVASTGVFTIPLMKRSGFSGPFAGAVESTASIGGQILPPIMGAAAFVMADFLGVPYSEIISHAIIPAMLFYIALFVTVHLASVKDGIGGVDMADAPRVREVMRGGGHFLVPLFILIYSLGVRQNSVPRGAFYAIVSLVVLEFGKRLVERRPLELHRLVDGCVAGAKGGVLVATTTAAVQLVIATVGLTGIGLKLSSLLVDLAGGRLWLLLILTMCASLLLGTGLPTVPTYLVLAVLTAPALTDQGVPLIAAHFFVFYFGVVSDLTPPTALGPTVAAGIAGANPMSTMMQAMRLGLVGFILPYMFVYSPGLLLDGNAVEIAYAVTIAVVGVVFLAVALAGFLFAPTGAPTAVGFGVASLFMIHPSPFASVIGGAFGLILVLRQLQVKRTARAAITAGRAAVKPDPDSALARLESGG